MKTKNKGLTILMLIIILIVSVNLLQFAFGLLGFFIKLAMPFILIFGLWKLISNSFNKSKPY